MGYRRRARGLLARRVRRVRGRRPSVTLGFVLLYNAYYQRNYRRLGNVAVFNTVQLLLDIAVVTLLIYYSGGVYSWFAQMYLLFVLEAALILPTPRQVWAVVGAAMAAYVAVLLLVYVGVFPHASMPLVQNDLQGIGSYVIVRALWELTVLGGAATVGTLLMRQVRAREERLTAESVRDLRTGLYTRSHFRRELGFEIERSRRYHRGVSVVLADIDDLDRLNTMFGFEAGNSMITHAARAISAAASAGASAPESDLTFVARYGGEEFAVFIPEVSPGDGREGEALAQRLRVAVGDLRDDDRSVTVSVGVSVYPTHGRTAAELIGAADAALSSAYLAGGNRVSLGRGGSVDGS
jgi:diguanylate cyclase (GGDEF)-like protein